MPPNPAPKDAATHLRNIYRRGTAFKETDKGALYLDFEPGRILALRPVPARAWVTARRRSSTWKGIRDPDVDVAALLRATRAEDDRAKHEAQGMAPSGGVPGNEPHGDGRVAGDDDSPRAVWRRRHFRSFLQHVPADVQDLCAAGFSGNTWPLFRLLQTIPAARDVCATAAGGAVVYALAVAHALLEPAPVGARGPDTLRLARRWIALPRKEILGRLGFAPHNASVNTIAKIPRAQLDAQTLQLARTALAHTRSFKLCCHLPRLPHALLAVLQPAVLPHVGARLVTQLLADERSSFAATQVARDVADSAALARGLGQRVPVFGSLEQLKDVHDRLASAALDVKRGPPSDPLAPFPPFPGNLTTDERACMRQLMSREELIAEGAAMQHCLGTLTEHWRRAQAGTLYVFAVERAFAGESEERLTLAVQTTAASRWGIDDFRGHKNGVPSQHAWAWAEAFLARLNCG